MDDFKWIFYVVVAVIYFIAKSRGKKPSEPVSEDKPFETRQPSNPAGKPVTFEDLLKEIQSSKPVSVKSNPQLKPAIAPQPSKYAKYEDYDDQIDKDEKNLEDVNYDYKKQDQIYETYEKAKKQAFLRPSLEETVKLENTVVKYGQFKEYSKDASKSLASTLGAELQKPESFKKAFILSEILKRKY